MDRCGYCKRNRQPRAGQVGCLFCFLGTNDWWQGLPLGTLSDYIHNTGIKTTYGAYRIIINKIRQLNPDAKIILITPMQRTDFVYIANANNARMVVINQKTERILRNLHVLSMRLADMNTLMSLTFSIKAA